MASKSITPGRDPGASITKWARSSSPERGRSPPRQSPQRPRTREGHPRIHRRTQLGTKAFRLDQDRGRDPRQHRALRTAHSQHSWLRELVCEPLGQDTRVAYNNHGPRPRYVSFRRPGAGSRPTSSCPDPLDTAGGGLVEPRRRGVAHTLGAGEASRRRALAPLPGAFAECGACARRPSGGFGA